MLRNFQNFVQRCGARCEDSRETTCCLELERPNDELRALEARRSTLEAAPPLFGFATTPFAITVRMTLDKSCFSHDSWVLVAFNDERPETQEKA